MRKQEMPENDLITKQPTEFLREIYEFRNSPIYKFYLEMLNIWEINKGLSVLFGAKHFKEVMKNRGVAIGNRFFMTIIQKVETELKMRKDDENAGE